jgi:hypothetical protein
VRHIVRRCGAVLAMSTDALAAVNALHAEAQALCDKGQWQRSAEIESQAVDAARALGYPDCLIVAHLQVFLFEQFMWYAFDVGNIAPEQGPALNEMAPLLFDAAVTLLERLQAGTLLPGACRPLEDAFYSRTCSSLPPRLGFTATYIGYETLHHAASNALSLLSRLRGPHFTETFDRLAPLYTQLAVQAAGLSMQPRSNNGEYTLFEGMFTSSLRKIVQKGCFATRNAAMHQELLDAWTALQRSGQLELRDTFGYIDLMDARQETAKQEAVARHSTATLRCCAMQACGAREVRRSQYKRCAACATVVYCSRAHQLEDWPSHKKACRAARAAAASTDGGGSAAPNRGE